MILPIPIVHGRECLTKIPMDIRQYLLNEMGLDQLTSQEKKRRKPVKQ